MTLEPSPTGLNMLCNSTLFETTDRWPHYADPPRCAPAPVVPVTAINSRTRAILLSWQEKQLDLMVSISRSKPPLHFTPSAQLQRSSSPSPRPLQLLIESVMPVSRDSQSGNMTSAFNWQHYITPQAPSLPPPPPPSRHTLTIWPLYSLTALCFTSSEPVCFEWTQVDGSGDLVAEGHISGCQ